MIVEWRRAHPTWGPRMLVNRLAREGVDPLPSRSSVYRALVRHQLIVPWDQPAALASSIRDFLQFSVSPPAEN